MREREKEKGEHLGVNGFSDAAEDAQRGAVVSLHEVGGKLHH